MLAPFDWLIMSSFFINLNFLSQSFISLYRSHLFEFSKGWMMSVGIFPSEEQAT